jgi:hypothetical protein
MRGKGGKEGAELGATARPARAAVDDGEMNESEGKRAGSTAVASPSSSSSTFPLPLPPYIRPSLLLTVVLHLRRRRRSNARTAA